MNKYESLMRQSFKLLEQIFDHIYSSSKLFVSQNKVG